MNGHPIRVPKIDDAIVRLWYVIKQCNTISFVCFHAFVNQKNTLLLIGDFGSAANRYKANEALWKAMVHTLILPYQKRNEKWSYKSVNWHRITGYNNWIGSLQSDWIERWFAFAMRLVNTGFYALTEYIWHIGGTKTIFPFESGVCDILLPL